MRRWDTNWGPDIDAALGEFAIGSPAGKIGLEYRSRFWEDDHRIFGGITETDMDLAHVWYPPTGTASAVDSSSATTTPGPTRAPTPT